MNEFIKVPANKNSLAQRKLAYGVAKNDADYIVCKRNHENKAVCCKFYRTWIDMIKRCHSEKYREKYPTYKDCTVCDEWLTFSNFKAWMKAQDWQGKQLDKDLLIQGNKHYSPETCLFVTSQINTLLTDNSSYNGDYPEGVSYHKQNKKIRATIVINGKQKSLGYHKTVEQAAEAYKKAKYSLIKSVALNQLEPLRSALLNWNI